jgi:hypothetical protein
MELIDEKEPRVQNLVTLSLFKMASLIRGRAEAARGFEKM